MYSTRANYILGFHGCDKSVRDKVTKGEDSLRRHSNDYDWLGNGIYFWENNFQRALDYAKLLKKYPKRTKSDIRDPSVIEAVIDLGHCIDLLDAYNLQLLKLGYEILVETRQKFGLELPENKSISGGDDLLLRNLDCAVIETIHNFNEDKGKTPFDSVRSVFTEGKELFPNAGFKEKNHIQLCIRNPNCIKGYFIPRELDSNFSNP
jgi:hypothetical protein